MESRMLDGDSGSIDPAPTKDIVIALVGDSTVFEYPSESPMRGWGQVISAFLPAGVSIVNNARCGASTKTYPRELWQTLLTQSPDYLLIQFGHNDSHPPENFESTDSETDFPKNLKQFLEEARNADVQPILVTPVRRRTYQNGLPTTELSPYAASMKRVALDLDVPFIDLHAASGILFETIGESGTDSFTVNKIDTADRQGAEDRSHLTLEGARAIAPLVAKPLLEIIDLGSK